MTKPIGLQRLTPLHLAVISEQENLLRFFLTIAKNLSPVDWKGFTPLHHAALRVDKVFMEILWMPLSLVIYGKRPFSV